MKIECIKEKLEKAIIKADKVTSKNVTLPVLKYVLLIAKENNLIIRATNLDLGLEIKTPVKVEEEGVVAVPADVLKSFISNLPNDSKISLISDGKTLEITTGGSKTTIKTYPYDEFPSIPTVQGKEVLKIASEKLLQGLRSVWYSASPASMKPELSSIYVYYEDEHMVFAATDSFRLAEKKVSIKKLEEFESILIPFKNVGDIIKVLDDVPGEIEIHLTPNQISMAVGEIYITSRVIDGIFPDYRQIIPKEYETEGVVLKQDVLDVLKRSNIFSDKFNRVTFEISPKSKKFKIHTSNQEVGESTSEVPAALTGEDVKLSFSYRNVIDSFQSISADSVVFKFGERKPLLIQGVGDPKFTYITMPMNK